MSQPDAQPGTLEELRASRANFPHLNDELWTTVINAYTHFGRPLVQAVLQLTVEEQQTTIQQLFRAMREVTQARNLAQVAADAARQAAQDAANAATQAATAAATTAVENATQRVLQNTAQATRAAAVNVVENAAQRVEHAAQRALRAAPMQQAAPEATPRPIKFRVSNYSGKDKENILRWFIELETAMTARLITVEEAKVGFAISQLNGRAKDWALGLKLIDPFSFPDYETFKDKLRATFEPTQHEFRARTDFLSLRQGNRSLHDYIQDLRFLISCCIEVPIDPLTQITRFMMGLNPGPIRDEVYRHEYETLDEAIRKALETEFRVRRNHYDLGRGKNSGRSNGSRSSSNGTSSSSSSPTPMDVSAITTTQHRNNRDKSRDTCHNCGEIGHWSPDCKQVRRSHLHSNRNKRSNGQSRSFQRGGQTSKNVEAR